MPIARSRPRVRRVATWAPVLAFLAAIPAARADAGDPVVVRAGTASATVSGISQALSALSAFQLGALGGTRQQILRKYVDQVVVPGVLFAAEADRRRLRATPAVAQRIDDAESRALVDSIRRDLTAKGVADADVRAYYDAHLSDYQKPERIRIWRILVNDEATARALLAEFRGVDGPERWSSVARERSVDDATKMRGGILGFVLPDGHTDIPQLEVAPALYAAAARVRDGALVPDPVQEGTRFAVVWRRGTIPKVARTFEQERETIVNSLIEERTDRAVSELLSSLRKQYVTVEDSSALDSVRADEPHSPPPRREPSPVTSADPTPKPTDRGLR